MKTNLQRINNRTSDHRLSMREMDGRLNIGLSRLRLPSGGGERGSEILEKDGGMAVFGISRMATLRWRYGGMDLLLTSLFRLH